MEAEAQREAVILQNLKNLKAEAAAASSSSPKTLAELGLQTTVFQVADLPLSDVISKIQDITTSNIFSAINSAENSLSVPNPDIGENLSFWLPSRSAEHQMFVRQLDRNVLRINHFSRCFLKKNTVRKATLTLRVLRYIRKICQENVHATKREIFYTDPGLFNTQAELDSIIDDVACILTCTRSSLNVVATEKSSVVGCLKFTDDGDEIDCTKLGVGGKNIPPNIRRIGGMQSDALFILLIEKDAVYHKLAEEKFYQRFPCIIMTGKGQPDVASRLFLRKMKNELKLPILALMDSDPYGLGIISVYRCGSKNMSYDGENLATPDIMWLGLRPGDLDKYNIPESNRLPMEENDVKKGNDLLKEGFLQYKRGWKEELEKMLKSKQMAEIEVLSVHGARYLTTDYLPRKFEEKDWLRE